MLRALLLVRDTTSVGSFLVVFELVLSGRCIYGKTVLLIWCLPGSVHAQTAACAALGLVARGAEL